MKRLFALSFLITQISSHAGGLPWPAQPVDPRDPGAAVEQYEQTETSFEGAHGTASLWIPTRRTDGGVRPAQGYPVVVFGRGHLVPLLAYRKTFEHLARRGVAVIFPEYKEELRSSNYPRMGEAYAQIASEALAAHRDVLDPRAVVLAGHSDGASNALRASRRWRDLAGSEPSAILLYAISEHDPATLKSLDPAIPVTFVVGDHDERENLELSHACFNDLTVERKQLIVMRSYLETSPQIEADHGFVRTASLMGGRLTPLHYLGSWRHLVAAAWDASAGQARSAFLYGDRAKETGIPGASHQITRSAGFKTRLTSLSADTPEESSPETGSLPNPGEVPL